MLGTSRGGGMRAQVTEETGDGQDPRCFIHRDLSAAAGLDSSLAAGCPRGQGPS